MLESPSSPESLQGKPLVPRADAHVVMLCRRGDPDAPRAPPSWLPSAPSLQRRAGWARDAVWPEEYMGLVVRDASQVHWCRISPSSRRASLDLP